MLSFRQFLECNDVDTSQTKADELGNMNWHYEPAYRMYCNAMAHELQKEPNYKAYVPIPIPTVDDNVTLDEPSPY